MNKKMKKVVAIGIMMAEAACFAAPIVGNAVGSVVARAATHEVAEAAAKRAAKTGVGMSMSSALAGTTAKQIIGAGVAVGTAVAIPVAAHEIADGYQEVNTARAAAIRETGTAAAQTVWEHPETASAVLATVNHSNSVMERINRTLHAVLPWGAGLAGVFCLMYLFGFGLKSFACVRRGLAEARTTVGADLRAARSSEEAGRPEVAPYQCGRQS